MFTKKTTLFNSHCCKKDICKIKDIITGYGNIINLASFKNIYGARPDVLLVYNTFYNALIVHSDRIQFLCKEVSSDGYMWFGGHQIRDLDRKSILKLIKPTSTPNAEAAWSRLLNIIFSREFWKLPFESTKDTRLRVLQWKILHNIYPSGTLLYQMKIKPSDLCKFCGARGTILHFFFECKAVSQIWNEIKKLILIKTNYKISLTVQEVLLGVLPKKGIKKQDLYLINHLILIGKLVISKGKYGKVSNFISILEHELMLRKINRT